MSDDPHDHFDELIDADPLQLRDEALALFDRANRAEAERDQLLEELRTCNLWREVNLDAAEKAVETMNGAAAERDRLRGQISYACDMARVWTDSCAGRSNPEARALAYAGEQILVAFDQKEPS